MLASVKSSKPRKRRRGLRFWMLRVLGERAGCERALTEDAVHDLRVALRRCRTLAADLESLDPDGDWQKMSRQARRLFRKLGDLRDAHVQFVWLKKLAPAADPVRNALLARMAHHAHRRHRRAARALRKFDSVQWREWMTILSARAQLFRPGGPEFRRLALTKCDGAFACHRAALRHPSPAAFHLLRIALKRFRYCVENFLPKQHALWIRDLKVLQDLLGEVHDMDVLWTQLPEAGRSFDAQARLQWRARIHTEREKRLTKYRQKMTGRKALWREWRSELF